MTALSVAQMCPLFLFGQAFKKEPHTPVTSNIDMVKREDHVIIPHVVIGYYLTLIMFANVRV